MTSDGVEKSPSLPLNSHNSRQVNQRLAEELKEVEQSVKAMLNLIRDGGFPLDEIDEKKQELINHVEGLHRMYRSLAEKYDHLTEEANPKIQNTAVSHSDLSAESLLLTPTQKLGMEKSENQAVAFNLSPSSGHGSSDFSDKGGSENSSTASDSESEAFYSVANKKTSDLRVNLQENEGYATLLRRVTKYEEELKESNRKLCFSNEEIAKLKDELEKLSGVTTLVDDLQDELELTQRERTIRDGDLEVEKSMVLKLQGEIAEYEAMSKSEKRIILELKERILSHEADAYEREQEMKKLNIALFDTQKIYSLEKAKLDCDISIMSEQLTLLKARAEESEIRIESLANEKKQCEAEKMKWESMYENQRVCSWGEIGKLKADVFDRDERVEALNKDFDKLKVKYDMLVAERDELNAKVQALNAEMSVRNNVIFQLEENRNQSHMDCMKVMDESERAKRSANELSVRVVELETEVERQRDVISERGEEKKEAIRQLCFAIEHYRNDYEELRKAVVGHRHVAV